MTGLRSLLNTAFHTCFHLPFKQNTIKMHPFSAPWILIQSRSHQLARFLDFRCSLNVPSCPSQSPPPGLLALRKLLTPSCLF